MGRACPRASVCPEACVVTCAGGALCPGPVTTGITGLCDPTCGVPGNLGDRGHSRRICASHPCRAPLHTQPGPCPPNPSPSLLLSGRSCSEGSEGGLLFGNSALLPLASAPACRVTGQLGRPGCRCGVTGRQPGRGAAGPPAPQPACQLAGIVIYTSAGQASHTKLARAKQMSPFRAAKGSMAWRLPPPFPTDKGEGGDPRRRLSRSRTPPWSGSLGSKPPRPSLSPVPGPLAIPWLPRHGFLPHKLLSFCSWSPAFMPLVSK